MLLLIVYLFGLKCLSTLEHFSLSALVDSIWDHLVLWTQSHWLQLTMKERCLKKNQANYTFWNKLIMKPWWKQWSWKTSTLWSLLTSQRKVLCLAHLKYQQPPTPSLYDQKNLTALHKSLSMQNSSWENLRIFLHNLHIMSSQLRIYDSTFCCLVGLAFSLVWLIGN